MSESGDVRPELAPGIQRFRDGLENERKKLLRDKSGGRPTFSDPEQLRQFIAQYLYPQMIGMVEMFGLAFQDVYSTAMSNASDMISLRKWSVRNFKAVGLDVSDEGGGVSAATLSEAMQEFYALGTLLERKLPGDAEVGAQWNAVAEQLSRLYGELQSAASGGEDEDDEAANEDDEDEGDGGDKPGEDKPQDAEAVPSEPEAGSSKPEPEA